MVLDKQLVKLDANKKKESARAKVEAAGAREAMTQERCNGLVEVLRRNKAIMNNHEANVVALREELSLLQKKNQLLMKEGRAKNKAFAELKQEYAALKGQCAKQLRDPLL